MKEKKLAAKCSHCHEFQFITLQDNQSKITCPQCKKEWGEIKNQDDIFDSCPVCGCRQFYLSKNFNQALGCLVMVVAIIFVPMTYGLSMPVGALIDWILYKRVPTITNCYRCGLEFHGWDNTKRFKPFMHHIGLKYDKYR